MMADEYVRREDLINHLAICKKGTDIPNLAWAAITAIECYVRDMPAADVAPVVHGRWIDGAEDFTCGNHNAECSICRCYVSWDGCDEDFNYCPNCGARMDGGNEGE